jgi:hypothetical protein
MSAKTDVLELVQRMPDNASLEDIQYQLYVREKIQKSLDAVAGGKAKSNKEAAAIIASWRK